MTSPYLGLLLDVDIWELVKGSEPIPLACDGYLGSVFALFLDHHFFEVGHVPPRAQIESPIPACVSQRPRAWTRWRRRASNIEPPRWRPYLISATAKWPGRWRRKGKMTNPLALERTLQLGMSEEITKLERNMSWLATTATVSPFIGLLGTVWGIINAFNQLGLSGSTSMRAVGPGIAQALIATALGLVAAIPAAVFYNWFGHKLKEHGRADGRFFARVPEYDGTEFRGLASSPPSEPRA